LEVAGKMDKKKETEHHKKKKQDIKQKIKEEFKALKQKLEEKTSEAEEYKNLAQRIKAEFDNYKKRVLKENEERIKLANEALIQEILPILDAFERGLNVKNMVENNEKFASFYEGMEMIYKRLKDLLATYGLKEIDALNKPFDPQYHDALMMEQSDKYKEETVIEVLEKGYMLNDKVLRPAKVKVGKPLSEISSESSEKELNSELQGEADVN